MVERFQCLWLSIHPRFAEAILEGEKTVELRRVRPTIARGDLVVIYASAPVMAVVGLFWVDFIAEEAPSVLWTLTQPRACVSRQEFRDYFSGASNAVAIYVDAPLRLRRPVPLAAVQRIWPGFKAPQSYRYLCQADVHELLEKAETRLPKARQLTIPSIGSPASRPRRRGDAVDESTSVPTPPRARIRRGG